MYYVFDYANNFKRNIGNFFYAIMNFNAIKNCIFMNSSK